MGVFAGTASFALVGSYTKASDLSALTEAINYSSSPNSYTNGSGANQVNAFYSGRRTLAATNESFDLNAITDSYGTVLNFLTIKLLYIKNKSTAADNTGNLILSGNFLDGDAGNGPLGGTSPVAIIGPGGLFLYDSPVIGSTVTNTTKDTITLTNTTSFAYDIILLGTVA
jgi:hypothetical protein